MMPEPKAPEESPALRWQATDYPPHLRGRVPKRIRMTRYTTSDAMFCFAFKEEPIEAKRGATFECWVNSYGAVAALVDGRALGVKPHEFEVTEWWDTEAVAALIGGDRG